MIGATRRRAEKKAAQIADKAFEHLDAPVRRYTAPEVPTFPYAEVLENMVLPDTAGIVAEAHALAKYGPASTGRMAKEKPAPRLVGAG